MTLHLQRLNTLGETLSDGIARSTEPHRSVLAAIYKNLVRSNLASFNGKGGREAAIGMTGGPFDAPLLSDFISRSGTSTAVDAIVFNVENHEPVNGYEILPEIIEQLKALGFGSSTGSAEGSTQLARWETAVLAAAHRYSKRHNTRLIRRAELLEEELARIVDETRSKGATPDQTLSRVLQDLRKRGLLHHVEAGVDVLIDEPLDIESEDFPDAAVDAALSEDKLFIGDVETGSVQVLQRRRRGQAKLHTYVLRNYGSKCALCDVTDPDLLITSHIDRWGDNPGARGRLANNICLCRMHDALFEAGYIALGDDLSVLLRKHSGSAVLTFLQTTARVLRRPKAFPPSQEFLAAHRKRTGHTAGESTSA